jgi:dolichol-phosphate mannosyltransferase
MRALVTGAGGFVGANLVRRLLARGDEPVAILRPGPECWRLEDLAADARIEYVDLTCADDVARAVNQIRPDAIFNLAAHGAYSWQTDFDEMIAVNVTATETLLEVARHIDARFVHAGSSSEYGFSERPTSELDRAEPNSHYAIAKLAATHLCRLAATRHGQHAVVLRLYSVYGPWEEPGRLMPTLVERALDGTYPPLVSPDTARDFVWVDDVCDAFIRAATAELAPADQILNLASGHQTTLRTLVATAREVFDLGREPQWGGMEQRIWDTSVWVGDPARAQKAIGWRASTPLSAGLAGLAGWMQESPQWRERYRPRVPAAR